MQLPLTCGLFFWHGEEVQISPGIISQHIIAYVAKCLTRRINFSHPLGKEHSIGILFDQPVPREFFLDPHINFRNVILWTEM